MKSTLLLLGLLCASVIINGQDYFQQDVAYDIHVSLDDEAHMLHGNLSVEYTNNSSLALEEIWMHLWPNAYKNGKTALAKQQYRDGDRFMFYAISKELGYIDSLDFATNGSKVQWEYHPEHIDIAKLNLPAPLAPGDKVTITTPFRVKLPTGKISRLGHIGQSYQITQWYPKPAVFDKDGWHAMPYLNQGEFYSEYGSFDVHITLPKNYVIGATGDLVDCPEEVAFMNEMAERGARLTAADFENYDGKFPSSSAEKKTLHFHQEDVHDFAWFADKRWNVLKGEVELPNTGRKVTSWALFTGNEGELWLDAIEYINDGTYYYSKWNGDYPYNHVTAVDGTISAGGGMEYPNITVIGNSGNEFMLETVIVHEVGHNWFYGILGSNERDNAWMDEGINSYNETRYFIEKYKDSINVTTGMIGENVARTIESMDNSYRSRDEIAYLLSARTGTDQPMQCHSPDFTGINYGTIVYKKTAVAMDYLANALGQERFDQAMRAYFDTWKFRHPAPDDLRKVLEDETGEDLSWWFDDLLTTAEKPDYAIWSAKKSENGTEVTVSNKGGVKGPFNLTGYVGDEAVESSWYPGIAPGESKTIMLSGRNLESVIIDPEEKMLEYDRRNNYSRTSGLFKRMEPMETRWLTRIEEPGKTQLFWTPVAAWNEQDKFMFGVNVHNAPFPVRDLEWSATPMFAFGTNALNGFARLSKFKGRKALHLTSQRFSDFNGNRGYLPLGEIESIDSYTRSAVTFEMKSKVDPTATWEHSLAVEGIHLFRQQDLVDFFLGPDGFSQSPLKVERHQLTARATYVLSLNHPTLNSDIQVVASSTSGMDGLEPVDYDLYAAIAYDGSIPYNAKDRKAYWRVFYGIKSAGSNRVALGTAGLTGRADPSRDFLFLQRFGNNDFLARQVSNTQGALGISAQVSEQLFSMRAAIDAPVKLPLRLYGGVGIPGKDDVLDPLWVAGVTFPIIPNILEVHLPLATDDILDGPYNPGQYWTFELHLDRMNPWKLIRNIGG